MSKRLTILVLLTVWIVALLGWRYGMNRGSRVTGLRLHVLLITLDIVLADRLGYYGYDKATSPNLDRFVAESTQFDLAIAQAAVTPVSHASILTGLEPYHHGLRVLHGLVANRLAQEHTTLAELWGRLGGRTSAFVSAFPVTAAFGLDQGFVHFDADFPQADGKGLVGKKGTVNTGMSQRRADRTTEAAIEWLDEHAQQEAALFMWVHYFDPHDLMVLPPQPVLDRFKPALGSNEDRLRAIYDAEIHYMDSQIGELLEAWKGHGLWDRTIVAVVSDHGEGLGDHDWWSHGILYQEQIRVPMMIRVPGLKGGDRFAPLVRTIDLMPTILEAAGIDPAARPKMDGISLLDAMRTGRSSGPQYVYADSVHVMTYRRLDQRGKKEG